MFQLFLSNVMRDSQAPQYSPLAGDASTTEMTGCTNKASVLSSLLAEMEKAMLIGQQL